MISSQRGSILLQVLALAAFVSVISAAVLQSVVDTAKQSRYPRIKARMSLVEQRVREALMTPSAFACVNGPGGTTCTPNSAFLSGFSTAVDGGQCVPGPCRIVVENLNYIAATKHVTGRIRYEGTEFGSAPITFDEEVPAEVLQVANWRCPAATPMFFGFLANGQMDCRALPNGGGGAGQCPAGSYMVSLDRQNLAVTCLPIQEAPECPAGQFFTSYRWAPNGTISVTCGTRIDPITYFGFNPGTMNVGPMN